MADINFFLNGKPIRLTDPPSDLLLIDYLRGLGVGLSGPKKPCGQGGCGGCTVILSTYDQHQAPYHRAINACLRPVCSLNGFAITTVEGTSEESVASGGRNVVHSLVSTRGGTHSKIVPPSMLEAAAALAESGRSDEQRTPINKAAWALATNNGSQCGYCSVGFVMNMSEYLVNNRSSRIGDIEDAFDGNLCRCTGYRPILTGMKTLGTTDPSSDPPQYVMQCDLDPTMQRYEPAAPLVQFPDDVPKTRTAPDDIELDGRHWSTPKTLAELSGIYLEAKDPKKVRLVHGNTSYGIHPEEFRDVSHFVDISLIDALQPPPRATPDEPEHTWGSQLFSAAISYNDLIDQLEAVNASFNWTSTSTVALKYMLRRTAGRVVRNAATVAGNMGLMLKHIAADTGEPFPSDLCTVYAALLSPIDYTEFTGETFTPVSGTAGLLDLVERTLQDDQFPHRILIRNINVTVVRERTNVLAQKAALREVNSHSIVNCATLFDFEDTTSTLVNPGGALIVLGGIAPFPVRITEVEAAISGKELRLEDAPALADLMTTAVKDCLKKYEDRYRLLPSEGITDEYRCQLARGFLYKAIVNALMTRTDVDSRVTSAGEVKWGNWGPTSGRQEWDPPAADIQPVARPYIRHSALDQAAGRTHYTQELPVPDRCLHAAFVQSRNALATFGYKDTSGNTLDVAGLKKLLAENPQFGADFVDLITADDLDTAQGQLNLQGMGMDQPMLADGEVRYYGQAIALVLASSEQAATTIADYVSAHCLSYGNIGWPSPQDTPVLSLLDAVKDKEHTTFPDTPKNNPWLSHAWRITRPQSDLSWVDGDRQPTDLSIKHDQDVSVAGTNCRRVETSQLVGGQAHFYMETQACLALPEDGDSLTVYPSTQSPMEMHQTVAMITGLPYNQVTVKVASVGGGFGGKTEQARFTTGPIALAAYLTKRPVRLRMPRDADTAMIGKRHGYLGQVQLAIESSGTNVGRIHGFDVKLWGDGGAYYDCSFIVSNCIQTRSDNAYFVENFQTQIDVCRTNTSPSTAMRAFGDIQGVNIIENAIEDAAVEIGIEPHLVREANFYELGQETPFGQVLKGCYIKQVWDYLKTKCDFQNKSTAVEAFNKANRWRKQGISLIPVKYGSGYNWVQLEQSQAVVVASPADGTVTIHQAGVDMGQGLATQVLQVASRRLTIPMNMIRVNQPQTNVIPSPTSTGGSTGTPYSCEAVDQVCLSLRQRLLTWVDGQRSIHDDQWCVDWGIDYWNAPTIAGDPDLSDIITPSEGGGLSASRWTWTVKGANADRQSMVAELNAQITGGENDMERLTYKVNGSDPDPDRINRAIPGIELPTGITGEIKGEVQQFVGFTYSAACAVVEIDVLTGETKVLSVDIVYDMGKSMNPAIDIGQVEGAFIQGMGMLTSENLTYQPDAGGDQPQELGRPNAVNTWRYKIPAQASIPLVMNTYLFPRSQGGVPDNVDTGIYSAKEVGEPPLVLANCVFFAIKSAIRAFRKEQSPDKKDDWFFTLNAPATPQEVSRACGVNTGDLTP